MSKLQINYDFKSHNYNSRPNDILVDTIVIHYTVLNFEDSLKVLTEKEFGVSSHFLINTDGTIYNLVDPNERAWHAGVSYWRGKEKVNDNSIGIEIVNDGYSEFTEEQINSVIELAKFLKAEFPGIEDYNVIGHSDVAITRKIDPGKFFPWQKLADEGIGIWHNLDLEVEREALFKLGDEDAEILNLKRILSEFGYKVNNLDGNFDVELKSVIYAMQLHFDPEHATGEIDDTVIKIAEFLADYAEV